MSIRAVSRFARFVGAALAAAALVSAPAQAQVGPFDYSTIRVDLTYRPLLMTNDYTPVGFSFLEDPIASSGVFANPFGLAGLPGNMHVQLTLNSSNQGGPFHHGYGWHAEGSPTALGSILWSTATPNFVTTGIAAADAPYANLFNGPLIGLDFSSGAGMPQVHYLNFAYSDISGAGLPGDRWIWFAQTRRTAFINDPGNGYIAYELVSANIAANGVGPYSGPITTPIPEPETYALMLAGLGLLGFSARRRKTKETQARPAISS